MLELSDESIQLNRTRECHLHKYRIIARHTIVLNHIRNAFYKRIGQLELNAFEPVIFYTLFESIETLGHAALAKESLKTNVPVRTLAVTKGYVTEAEA